MVPPNGSDPCVCDLVGGLDCFYLGGLRYFICPARLAAYGHVAVPNRHANHHTSESPRSRTWQRYLELDLVEGFNVGKFRILISIIMLLGPILH
jgi:hypothetical protein